MDARVSDVDDISILIMKMQKGSCSRLGSKHQHKLFFVMPNYGVILVIMDMASAKSDVNGPKKKVCS